MKEKKRNLERYLKNKKAQVTIFIILAVLIVVAGVLVYLFSPGFRTIIGEDLENPQQYIQKCVSEDLKQTVEEVSLQGGSLNPEAYYQYSGEQLEYLCYSGDFYDLCSVQRPFLRTHVESEIKKGISDSIEGCFSSLKEEYENRGYNVNVETGELKVSVLPKRVSANLNKTVYLRKDQNTEKHKNFNIVLQSKLYKMINIADSIVEWESAYGTAEPSFYMNIYHDLLIRKKNQNDETTVYIIEDNSKENKFQFASRSLAFPPGYGEPSEEII